MEYLNAGGDATGVDLNDGDCPVERSGGGFRMKRGSGHFWGDLSQPMVEVSWEAATRFAAWLSQQEGVHYRLPTEAEWEYAARAGSTSKYSFGDDEGRLGEYAWYEKKLGRQDPPCRPEEAELLGFV